jgi:hypothetical protein
MTIRIYKFRDITEMEHFLNGGILGGPSCPVFDGQPGIPGLVGQTLTFTAPAGAVTFVAGQFGDYLRFLDIKSQIEAVLTTLSVVSVNGNVGFVAKNASYGVALSGNTEIAKAILGFAYDKAAAGKVYGADPATAPAMVEAYAANDGSHTVFCVE